MPSFLERIQHGWNAFLNGDSRTSYSSYDHGSIYRPDRRRSRIVSDRSLVNALYNRISIDVASITFQHVKVDENGRYKETVKSGLNDCLNVEANIDQTGREFIQDIVHSMCDEGYVAAVPIETDINPNVSGGYSIDTMRTGRIVEWFPDSIKVDLYNDRTGRHEEVRLPKKIVAVIPNPLYETMNAPNSTLQRVIRKLNLLDSVDEQASSGKLDLIIQLPYTVKSELRQKQANKRRKDIEMQLTDSKYGIAYIDSTEKITQLNRSLENNLLKQIEYLMNTLYAQMGISEAVFKGEADEQTMLLYYNRTIEPFCAAIADNMKRKFITKTGRTQGHSIMYFRDSFKLVPTSQIAELADKFTRNEIMSPNEVRAILGMKPDNDPKSDELRNRNLNESAANQEPGMVPEEMNQGNQDVPIE